ncbi:methylated-DNA--[protein]-cysteine S-methyltransferase [Aliidiomarina quisquiliarum]|uniref:methylated-DNA--[protein]-cysteine S-methyltransferase n=1 Tax=Aliidiomarina quisquiliarum TaxID=2938947 RepID=UPI00208F4608|nr:methylated-DNA--[protein]-cysteine S-methyltransferase [Aliidiomarina quisquiliarum]MCO4321496.1 methylated-DNA--[protein]-cysteine S-methyltransferase [Aliidiomarina quisquiliarum]
MSNNTKHCRVIQHTPVGHLLACAAKVEGMGGMEGLVITQLDFLPAEQLEQGLAAEYQPASFVLEQLESELKAYFAGQLKEFTVPLAPSGTEFQQAVWAALTTIPYGATWSYKQLAEAVHRPKGYQAVGQANGRNPIAIVIPCHRVVAANGGLGGYTGGVGIKQRLLNLEEASCR